MGAMTNNYLISQPLLGSNLNVVAGENSFKIATGKYNLTLYLSQGILVVEKWTEPQPVVRGDVTGNGEVDVNDVTALIGYILTGNATGLNLDNAQCDNISDIDINDVTALIRFVLNGSW